MRFLWGQVVHYEPLAEKSRTRQPMKKTQRRPLARGMVADHEDRRLAGEDGQIKPAHSGCGNGANLVVHYPRIVFVGKFTPVINRIFVGASRPQK